MAIEVIDKIKQKNSGSFKLMDAEDVQYDETGESVKEKIRKMEQASGEITEITDEELEEILV